MAGQPFEARKAQPPAQGISGNDYAGNFADFLEAAPNDGPWCFWYGSLEPHRRYEYGVGVNKAGKKLTDINDVPDFWPDNETTRNDMLDYAFEIEHFDKHLGRMLQLLEQRGQLNNTLVMVTSDNGMPFPRVKGQEYELSNHMPLAAMWIDGINKPGRVIDDYVSFIDFAPTFVEIAGLQWDATGMAPSPGRSLTDIFSSEKSGIVNPQRDHVLIGKERHDIGRPNDWGYPIRGIFKDNMLYLRNYETARWPAGNPETGYLNTDGSPTKTVVLNGRKDESLYKFWQLCFGKRPTEELYRVDEDRFCMENLAREADYQQLKQQLRRQLRRELEQQADPRALGNGEIFEQFPYADNRTKNFHQRYMAGEQLQAGWVNPTDFEQEPLD
jgi:hypothetical protein